MSNWHRIVWIDGKVRAGAYPDCRGMAEQFGISARQAARDVEYMRDSLGAPLVYCRRRSGYYYSEASFSLPSVLLTASQIRSLSYLSYRYGRTAAEPAEQELAELFRRLAHSGGESSNTAVQSATAAVSEQEELPVHPVKWGETERFGLLERAIRLQSRVVMDYLDEGLEIQLASFAPVQIFTYEEENCVLGFDEECGSFRLIPLRLIARVALEGGRYAVSPMMGAGNVMRVATREPYTAWVEFQVPDCAELLRHRCEYEGGRRFRIYFWSVDQLGSDLLGCPCEFRIVKPGWLRNMVHNRVQTLLRSL